MLNSVEFVNFCKEVWMRKWVYWYGTYGNECTMSKYESKKKQYPAHYGSGRTKQYMKDIENHKRCADCVGLIKAFFWCDGDPDNLPVYKINNCPDKSANGMYKICEDKGPISTLPDIPGLIVWKDGHIGVYIGDGYAIEMRGFDYDCKCDLVKNRPWTHWGKLPLYMLDYENMPKPEPEPEPEPKKNVIVTGGSVYVRKGPGVEYQHIGIVHKGDVLPYGGETYSNGWYLVEYKNQNGWISPKYSKLE